MITRTRKTRKPFQITLVSLSVADLLIAITLLTSGVDNLLISFNLAHFKGWFYLVQLSFYGFSLLSSMLHVSFIALQRLLVVLYPLRIKQILTGRRCLIVIAVIWVLCSGFITWGMLNLVGSVKQSGSKLTVHSTDSPLGWSRMTTNHYITTAEGSKRTVNSADSTLMSADIGPTKSREMPLQKWEMNGRLSSVKDNGANTAIKQPANSTFSSMKSVYNASTTRELIGITTIRSRIIRNSNSIILTPSPFAVNISTSISKRNSTKFMPSDIGASNFPFNQNRTDQATSMPHYSVLLELYKQPMTSLPYIVFSYVILITCAALVIIYSLTFILLKTRNSMCANKARKERYRFVLIYSISLTAIFITCTLPFTIVIHGVSYGNENVPLWPLFLNTTLDPVLYFLFSHCKKNVRCCCWFDSRNHSTTRGSAVKLQMPLM
eukprot:Seg1150.3 transcript_id=Seg1150.3/GoldUCD/mRNA.D3Y31 product="Melanocortin receptor 5" protein_id=Seg1150.3/GoldUCD/D3Y31